jgi:hypothetical protein
MTRAERHQYEAERMKPPRAKRPPPKAKRRDTADKGARNLNARADRNQAAVVAEESFGKRPSRKSTRKGPLQSGTEPGHAARMRHYGPKARHDHR